jgi:hypothetical protein
MDRYWTILGAWLIGACVMLAGVGRAQESQSFPVDAEVAVRATAYQLDELQSRIRATLELVAMTPAAKSGEWEKIEPFLAQAAKDVPAAWFYIRPDGRYYSLGQGLTRATLGDRPYFGPLMQGQPAVAYPIYSRSTGKRSAFFAAPVAGNGRITGAIGVSLFLDDLQDRINRNLGLPSNYTWYVLSSDGNTLLHRDPDFIFMNALTQGTDSLRQAGARMLAEQSGAMVYDLLGVPRKAVFQKLPRIDWWMVLAQLEPTARAPVQPELQFSLRRIRDEVQEQLNRMDASMAATLQPLQGKVLSEAEMRPALARLAASNPLATDVGFVNTSDILTMIEPAEYRPHEGANLGGGRSEKLRKSRSPYLSASFLSVEKIPAVVIVHPVFDARGELFGSVSMLVNPALLFRKAERNAGLAPTHELWAMETDGRILYDKDEGEIGRVLFTDPLYADVPKLRELGRRMVADKSGRGDYIFFAQDSKTRAIKLAEWETVSLHGTEWRVVVTSKPYSK